MLNTAVAFCYLNILEVTLTSCLSQDLVYNFYTYTYIMRDDFVINKIYWTILYWCDILILRDRRPYCLIFQRYSRVLVLFCDVKWRKLEYINKLKYKNFVKESITFLAATCKALYIWKILWYLNIFEEAVPSNSIFCTNRILSLNIKIECIISQKH